MESQFSFTSAPDTNASAAVSQDVSQTPSLPVSDVPSTAFQPEVPVVAPQQEPDTANVNVWADSINLSNGECNGSAIFDVVLTVSWNHNDTYQSAKIVKSIAFDKLSLLALATTGTNATVVEDKESKAKAEKQKKFLTTIRELSGVAGKDTFV